MESNDNQQEELNLVTQLLDLPEEYGGEQLIIAQKRCQNSNSNEYDILTCGNGYPDTTQTKASALQRLKNSFDRVKSFLNKEKPNQTASTEKKSQFVFRGFRLSDVKMENGNLDCNVSEYGTKEKFCELMREFGAGRHDDNEITQ